MDTGFLTGNVILDLSVTAWFIAQLLKVLAHWAIHHKLELRLLVSSGGMPSSHTAFVCGMTGSIGKIYGMQGPYFAIATVLSLVVMYDACNVRRAAGEQAKVLNHIMDHWTEFTPAHMGKELKELLGHTPLQVMMGAILGIIVGITGVNILAG